ncbi:MAG: hypothetical protein ACK46B_02000, partial [Bacteroidota bacterium]
MFIMTAISCTVVKKAPNLPFHFENNIKIDGNLTKDQKNELENSLFTQIEDSAQIRVASKIPWPSFPFIVPVEVMEKPTTFKKEALQQSVVNMQNLMSSMGYRKAAISFDTTLFTRKKQQRITTNFRVDPGNRFYIDTIIYLFKDSALQSLTHLQSVNALPIKGAPFDYNLIDAEINRLTDVFQNNGFFKINKEDLIVEVDTNYVDLYDAAIDPFELASRLSDIQSKKNQPFIKLTFRLRSNVDSTHFTAYTVGGLTIFPDLKTDEFSQITDSNFTNTDQIKVISLHNTFHDAFIKENIAMKPGSLFKRDDYSRTLNNFNKLGTWQNINITNKVDETNKKIDYILSLQPTKKQYFGIDLEGSSILNSSALSLVSSGRIGIATNFTLRNRNIGKRAIQL